MRLGVCSAATVVVAFMLGLPYGVVGVAASYFLANLLLAPISLMLAMRQLGGGLLPILKCLGGPAACSAIMCAALWILRATTPVLSTGIAGFAATCLIGATVYLQRKAASSGSGLVFS